MLDKQSEFKEKYHLKKLSNDNLLLYNTHALLKMFDVNNLKIQDLKHEYRLNNDGIEQIININDHQILINTQKNIYMYQY